MKNATTTDQLPWSAQQIDTFAKQVRLQWGDSWRLFGDDVKVAFVEQKAAQVVASAQGATFTGREVSRLIGELMHALKLS